MLNEEIKRFKSVVRAHYKKQGRHDLPWRHTTDAYAILVSEMMLQQTQVARVIPKYEAFLKRFPTAKHLARAPLSEVLTLWSGLGYNRRARFLHESAKHCVDVYKGVFPNDVALLETFPGIGHYTARAVAAFAYNTPVVCIETNIRTVYINHFFKHKKAVDDRAITALLARTLDTKHPREWYWALMDYGAYLKSKGNTLHRKSASYKKQSAFKGSRRAVRGAVIKALILKPERIEALRTIHGAQLDTVIDALLQEGMIKKERGYVKLVS